MALGKRYEIYLPITYNPDEQGNRIPLEKEKFTQTYRELWREFGGVTVTSESENQALRGKIGMANIIQLYMPSRAQFMSNHLKANISTMSCQDRKFWQWVRLDAISNASSANHGKYLKLDQKIQRLFLFLQRISSRKPRNKIAQLSYLPRFCFSFLYKTSVASEFTAGIPQHNAFFLLPNLGRICNRLLEYSGHCVGIPNLLF